MCDEYYGYREVYMTDEQIASFYERGQDQTYRTNEYIIIKHMDGTVVDMLRWDGTKFQAITKEPIRSRFAGKVSARNPQQSLAIDMLFNDSITVKMLAGKFGSGKTFLMSAAAVSMVEARKYDRIVYVRNNVEVKNSKPIGFLPGSYEEKLMPFAAPLADHLGGFEGLDYKMKNKEIEVLHLGFIRGRDIKNSIILCSEAENLTKEHIQLLISRVGEGSSLWLDGDIKQRDADVFMRNSGMAAVIERLAGHPRFGYVKLQKTERSETAAMADLLD